MEYTVLWKINLDADSPEDAARKALDIHRDAASWATHFEVRDAQDRKQEVDLGYPDESFGNETVHVLVPMEEGVVRDVQAFATEEAAERAKSEWLAARGLSNDEAREHAADWGTGIAIWECTVKRT